MAGPGRLSHGQLDASNRVSTALCAWTEDCPPTCPHGPPMLEQLPPLKQTAVLAVSAGANGVSGTLLCTSLERFGGKCRYGRPMGAGSLSEKAGGPSVRASVPGPSGPVAGPPGRGTFPGTQPG